MSFITHPAATLLALATMGLAWALPTGLAIALVCSAVLLVSVFAAMHHAEVVAHRVGEPYGTLVLALAITVIEVALILSLMLTGGAHTDSLPRDTLFATVMIICTGVVGLCILVGGLRHREQSFQIAGPVRRWRRWSALPSTSHAPARCAAPCAAAANGRGYCLNG